MKTIELLDATKEKLGIKTDTELCHALETSRARIGNYRTGIRTPDVEVCFKIAEILNVEPSAVITAVRVEGSSTPKERTFWERHAKRYGMLKVTAPFFMAGTLASAALSFAPDAQAAIAQAFNTSYVLCAVRRLWKRVKAWLVQREFGDFPHDRGHPPLSAT